MLTALTETWNSDPQKMRKWFSWIPTKFSPRKGSGYLHLLFRTDPSDVDLLLLAGGILAAIAAGIPFPLLGVLFGQLVDDLNSTACNDSQTADPAKLQASITHKVLLMIYISIANFVFIYVHTGCWSFYGERLVGRLRKRYFQSLLRQEIAYFDTLPPGEVSSHLTINIESIRAGTSEKVGLFVSSISYFVGAFVVAFIKVPRLAGMLVFLIPAYLLMALVGGNYIGRYTGRISRHLASASSIVSQSLTNVHLVYALGANERLESKLLKILKRAQNDGYKKAIAAATQFGCLFLIAYSANALAFWHGSKEIASSVDRGGSTVTAGAVYTVIFLLLDASFIVSQVAPFLHIFGSAAASAQALKKTADRSSGIDGTLTDSGKRPSSVMGDLSLENVSFSYPSRPEVEVLSDASIAIPARKLTAIVGKSGSGKSTLASLITRLYDPDQGRICLDGNDIRDLNVRYLRSCMGVVNQDSALINRSILENIALGLMSSGNEEYEETLLSSTMSRLSDLVQHGEDLESAIQRQTPVVNDIMRKVYKAAASADADTFIKNLEHGYATTVGVKGNELSGGQKQRICLARALIKEPKILLLDEATSALDSATEQNIIGSLENVRKGMTTIMVAHRLATVKDADNIIVMGEGKVVEQGSHVNLIARGGVYADMTGTQSLQVAGLVVKSSSDDSAATLIPNDSDSDLQVDKLEKTESTPVVHDRVIEGTIDDAGERRELFRTIRTFVRLSRPQRLFLIIGTIAATIAGGSYSAEAVIFGNVIGRLDPCQGSSKIRATGNVFGGLFFALGVIEFCAGAVSGSAFGRVAEKIVFKVRILAFRSLFHQDILWHSSEGRTPASLLSLFTSDTNALAGLSGVIVGTIVTILVNLVTSILLTHILAWKIAIVLLATLPILLGAGVMRLRVLGKCQTRHQKIYATSIGLTVEAVEAIKTIATLSLESEFFETYRRSLVKPYRDSFKEIAYANFWLATAYSISNLIYALAYWWGAKQIIAGNYSQTDFFIVLPALLFSAQSCGQMFALAPDVSNARMAASRLMDLLHVGPIKPTATKDTHRIDVLDEKRVEDIEAALTNSGSLPQPLSDHGHIVSLHHIQFHYPARPEIKVLHDLNIDISPNQFCALVGPSGAGKSTIISLIEKFYHPTSGTVSIDGRNIANLDDASCRASISLLPQDDTLFDDTIRFNIALGAQPGHEATDAEIEEACHLANITDLITSLPDGYNTRCGTNGDRFSGGQKQRLCIARALVRKPRLLLLDEPTSALDAASEAVFQETLDQIRGKMTIVAVAHRLHTIQKADCIFVIEGGRCVERGTHGELVQGSMRYRENALHQALG